jgi:hypothetical protein
MRRERQRGFCATRAAWIPVALWALLPVPLILPLQRVEAQQAGNVTPSVSNAQADEQITLLLGRVETLLDKGDVISPPGDNASEIFSRALVLSPLASPAGLRTMAEFPSALQKRADAEQAAGHKDLSVRIQVFAEAVSSVIGSRDPPPPANAAPSTQSGVATEAAGAAGSVARQAAGAATQANPTMPGPGTADAASSSKPITITDPRSLVQALRVPTDPIAQATPPPTGEIGQAASSGRSRNAESAKGSGSTQVAALPSAAVATAAAPDGIAATPGLPKIPAVSAAMVDALLKQGEVMLSIGDISAARLLFARAAESENGKAALALGDTYNPVFLAEHGVVGPLADPELARAWYRKALAFGEPRASEHLAELGGDTHAEAQGSINTQ